MEVYLPTSLNDRASRQKLSPAPPASPEQSHLFDSYSRRGSVSDATAKSRSGPVSYIVSGPELKAHTRTSRDSCN